MRDTIAVCLVQAYEEFQKWELAAIYHQAKNLGFAVQVFNTFEELEFQNLNDQGEKSIFDRINYEKICGMILFAGKIKDEELIRDLTRQANRYEVPLISLDRKIDGCYNILFDYKSAFALIVRHLFEVHNCRNVYVMAGMRNNSFSDERIEVVREIASEFGAEIGEENIGYGDFWEDPCRAEMERYLDSGRKLPDAIVAVNDLMAITICNLLRERGIRVPQDVIVTGFDGIEEERYYSPRLTTGQQDIEAAGICAVDIIADLLHNKQAKREHMIPFTVRMGQSCGCKPIGENNASVKVHSLFYNMKSSRYFAKHMFEMIDELSAARTLEGALDKLSGYIGYLQTFSDAYLCVDSQYLEEFGRLNEQIMACNPQIKSCSQIDMILLAEWHAKTGFEVPLTAFEKRELLPASRRSKAYDYLIYVPLHIQENVFGYIAADYTPDRNNYTQLRNFACNLSHILDSVRKQQTMENYNVQLKQANDKLEELYNRDPLTGIYNRRGFYQEIGPLLLKHHDGYVMVASVDLNGLKDINDSYGHMEGDYSIEAAGNALSECVWKSGICARFGGDEFSAAIFFDRYDMYTEADFKKRLKEAIDRINQSSKKPYDISCSCGTRMAKIDENTNINEMLKEADEGMYLDKKRHYEEIGRPDHVIR